MSSVEPLDVAVTIAAVERETGLSKDTLRIWERRYGFPEPLRDANGERLYPIGGNGAARCTIASAS